MFFFLHMNDSEVKSRLPQVMESVFGSNCYSVRVLGFVMALVDFTDRYLENDARCVSLTTVCLCFAHVRLFFATKTLFNTCVTVGTAQLKSNTLQESITCWVYRQRTELKWPTEKGQRGFYLKRTATKWRKIWSQRLHCRQMWTSFRCIDRQLLWKVLSVQLHRYSRDTNTDGDSSERERAVRHQKPMKRGW